MKFPVVCCIIHASILVKLASTSADDIILNLENGDDFENGVPLYNKIDKPNYKTTSDTKNSLADKLMYNIYIINKKRNSNDRGASVDLKKVAGARIKKFKPYTRPKFSEDYVDMSDFNFDRDTNVKKDNSPKPKSKDLNDHNLLIQIVARKMIPLHNKGIEEVDDEFSNESDKLDDNADESEDDEGKDGDQEAIHKRFEIINNSVEASSDKESDEVKELYMQAPTRFVKSRDPEWRRRLPNFLPKRVHWNEDDYKNLRNFWIGGSRGRYSG